MRNPLRRRSAAPPADVQMCERCGVACDAGCRARELRQAQLLHVRLVTHRS